MAHACTSNRVVRYSLYFLRFNRRAVSPTGEKTLRPPPYIDGGTPVEILFVSIPGDSSRRVARSRKNTEKNIFFEEKLYGISLYAEQTRRARINVIVGSECSDYHRARD